MAPNLPSIPDQPRSPPSRRSSTVSPTSPPSRRESVASVSQHSIASSRPSSSASRRPLPPLPTAGPRRTSLTDAFATHSMPPTSTPDTPSVALTSGSSVSSTLASDTQSTASTLISGNVTSRPSTAASGMIEEDTLPPYEYRSPEAVVEHFVEPSDSNLPPGVLAEHIGEDDNFIPQPEWNTDWNLGDVSSFTRSDSKMEIDPINNGLPEIDETPQRPQIGAGVLPKLWLDQIHPHKLWRPLIDELPQPAAPKSPSRQASLKQPLEGITSAGEEESQETSPFTRDQVWESLPGGKEDHQNWYFCPECWGWIHVLVGKGDLPAVTSFEEWEETATFSSPEERERASTQRAAELKRFNEMDLSRSTADKPLHHLHAFEGLIPDTKESRLQRVDVPPKFDAFSFHDPSYGESPPELTRYVHRFNRRAALYVSCSSDVWIFVDKGPISGQIPVGLVRGFSDEKKDNPGVGSTGHDSVVTAWELLITLLQNPLFRNQRGWFKLDSKTFRDKIGASLRSSHLLYRLGFVCKEDRDGYLVGPLSRDFASAEDVLHMNRYMARAWVEVSLGVQHYRMLAAKEGWSSTESKYFVRGQTLGEALDGFLHLSRIPELHPPYPDDCREALASLGASKYDTPATIEDAYALQVSEDYERCPLYLAALTRLSNVMVPGHELLQIKAATEKSLERYTSDDLDTAYEKIGLGPAEVDAIGVSREDIPIEYILSQHREAMNKVFDSTGRSELSRALTLIGKERKNEQLIELGRSGEAFISLDDAYKEFGLSRDSNIDDELLILQYETWISDRPSRSDHYRRALQVIAVAPGEERPALRAYLEGKDISEFQPPARLDIPAGLRNIGNTCYLNSVLQLLYALKPVREAVMSFSGDASSPTSNDSSDSESAAERKVKLQTSKHFVTLLRGLFEDMCTTTNASVTPQEELARLAILPVDLVAERKDSIAVPEKTRVTIDSLPTIMSPFSSPTSSGAATANDTVPSTPVLVDSPPSTTTPLRSERQSSVLGKRASEDRDSVFGSSEERNRRPTSMSDNLIDLQDSGPPTPTRQQSAASGFRDRQDSELTAPAADLSQLELASPLTEPQAVSEDGPFSPKREDKSEGIQAPSAPPPLPPRRKSMALVAAEKFGLQQDAAEILINVLAQLECAFDKPAEGGTKGNNLIKDLFSSKFQQQMLLQSNDGALEETHPPVESVFVHPIIGVEEEGKDLYDCLSELYLGGAEVEYEGKKGFKMDLIEELPPVLYILMRRSQYDPVKGRQVKINTHVPFKRALAMDRFLANADPAKRERSIALTREIMRMRTRRYELKNHKPMSIPDTFRFVRDALATEQTATALSEQADDDMGSLSNDITPDLLDALAKEGDDVEAEIADLETAMARSKEELEAIWSDTHSVEYELVSVFFHSGTGTGGHYWTYQADLPADGNKFFYYSDENVKEVPADDVFSDKSAQGVSPALLCYVRKDRDLVDTLHREPAVEAADAAVSGTNQ